MMIWKGSRKNEALSLRQKRIRKTGRDRRARAIARFFRSDLQHRPGNAFAERVGAAAQNSSGVPASGPWQSAIWSPLYRYLQVRRDWSQLRRPRARGGLANTGRARGFHESHDLHQRSERRHTAAAQLYEARL